LDSSSRLSVEGPASAGPRCPARFSPSGSFLPQAVASNGSRRNCWCLRIPEPRRKSVGPATRAANVRQRWVGVDRQNSRPIDASIPVKDRPGAATARRRRWRGCRRKNRPPLFWNRALERATAHSYSLSKKKRWWVVSFGSIFTSLVTPLPLLSSIQL
jgi:hypothetical protein